MFPASVYEAKAPLPGGVDEGAARLLLFLGNQEAPMNYADNTYPFRQDSSFLYFLGWTSPASRP